MGMALEESTDGLERLESNGINAYIDSGLYGMLSQRGNIYIDFITDRYGGEGFSIAVKRTPDEKSACC